MKNITVIERCKQGRHTLERERETETETETGGARATHPSPVMCVLLRP